MSDALTDIVRDQRRGWNYHNFLGVLTDYLEKKPDDRKLLGQVVEAAENTDAVRGGYWGGQTRLSMGIKEKVKLLREGDRTEWAKLLAQTVSDPSIYQRLKVISPFPDALLVHVDYGCGFVTIKGELEKFFTKLIRDQKGWKTYDADKYAVILPLPETENVEIIWLDCGIGGVDGPREVEK
ncbi:MAG: hypothetical protein ABII97_01185 [Patescibacteria group bacterium]